MVDRGGAVVEVLMTPDPTLSRQAGLNAWVTTYGLNVTTVLPKDTSTQTLLGVRETAYIINLSTMKIVWKYNGNLAGIGDSSGKVGVAQILTYL